MANSKLAVTVRRGRSDRRQAHRAADRLANAPRSLRAAQADMLQQTEPAASLAKSSSRSLEGRRDPAVLSDPKSCSVGTMQRESVIAKLKDAEAELRSRGVLHAALFGSTARGEERPDSDIDVMVEIDPEAHQRMDVFDYIGIVHIIEGLFSNRVDVSNRVAMKEHTRPTAERDAVYAF